jgi:hypothetical protein
MSKQVFDGIRDVAEADTGVRYPTKTDIRCYPVSSKNLPDIYRIVLELLLRFCERNGPLSFFVLKLQLSMASTDTAMPDGTG